MQREEAKRYPVELELDDRDTQASPPHVVASTHSEKATESPCYEPAELEDLMKAEAFHWPRLVLPPLKKSGHIVMDVCSPSGMWPSLCVVGFSTDFGVQAKFCG